MKKIIASLALIVSSTVVVQCGWLTEATAAVLFSEAEEVQMGANMHSQILADTVNYPLLPATHPLTKYIDSIGQEILKAKSRERTTIKYRFHVVNKNVINAFAAPGGYIYFYTGLISKAESEDEIAGVMGHEIGHVEGRHSIEQLTKQMGTQALIDLATEDGGTAESIGAAVSGLAGLKYSRDDESESDEFAVAYTSETSFNPLGMKAFMAKLLAMSGQTSTLGALFSSHPPSEERMEHIQELIDARSDKTVVTARKMAPVRVKP
jgi:beta-barrel assembly-enhancing protease